MVSVINMVSIQVINTGRLFIEFLYLYAATPLGTRNYRSTPVSSTVTNYAN